MIYYLDIKSVYIPITVNPSYLILKSKVFTRACTGIHQKVFRHLNRMSLLTKIVGFRNTEKESWRRKKCSLFTKERNSATVWFLWRVGENSTKSCSGNPDKGQPDILSGWTTCTHKGPTGITHAESMKLVFLLWYAYFERKN